MKPAIKVVLFDTEQVGVQISRDVLRQIAQNAVGEHCEIVEHQNKIVDAYISEDQCVIGLVEVQDLEK